MSLFRSEEMKCFNLVLPRESAWYIMNVLGQQGAVQLEDLNKHEMDYNKPYHKYIERCAKMESQLQTIETEILKNPELEIKK